MKLKRLASRSMSWSLASLVIIVMFLSLAACAKAGSVTVVPTPDLACVSTISQKVATVYGEQHPTIASVKGTLTDNDQQPMDAVELQGNFRNGSLHATHLTFSMLATGKKVWAVLATNDQHQQIWYASDLAL